MTDDDAAPGWNAIDAALDRIYPGVEPQHYGTILKYRLGGPDPLDGVSFYARDDHWHIVGYGMSELYAKESDDPGESGWGFEFTFRVGRESDETEPPIWAANFLQNLARYVYTTGNVFGPGHHLDLNGPISLVREDTAIRAITFADDPELGVIDTPHGRLRFLQVVGVTLDEYAVIETWNAESLLDVLRPHLPLLVTDLDRTTLTGRPDVAAAIAAGVRQQGSSTGSLYVEELGIDSADGTTVLTFGAHPAPRIGRILAARLPFDRGLIVHSRERVVGFVPGGVLDVAMTDEGATITIPPALLPELTAALRPQAGTYPLPGLTIRIAKSQIRDPDGTVVTEIG